MSITAKEKRSLGIIEESTYPRVLIWDIETAPMITTAFSLFNEYSHYENILQDWFIICASWKWLGHDKVYATSIAKNKKDLARYREGILIEENPSVDKTVIEDLHKVLSETDVIVGHNGDKFDLKMFNVRAAKYGLPPIPYIPSVDTLKTAKGNFRFSSNRLDYLGRFLGLGKKVETEKGLWKRCVLGDVSAIKKMVEYNEGDVLLLEKVYYVLRPYMRNHPNLNLINKDDMSCPKCESTKMQKRGFYRTRVSVFQRYQCTDCGGWTRSKKSIIRTDVR